MSFFAREEMQVTLEQAKPMAANGMYILYK